MGSAAASPGADVVAAIETALADTAPFGDSEYIWRLMCVQYWHRVEMLAEHSEYGRRLLLALKDTPVKAHARILGDPVVRIVIDRSVRCLKLGGPAVSEDDFRTVLEMAAAGLHADTTVPPLALAERSQEYLRLHDTPWPWVWSDARVDHDPLGDILRRLFDEDMLEGFGLMAPDPQTRAMLIKGAQLLHVLCPRLATSALSHVQLITVVTGPSPKFSSLTHPEAPGVIFVSPVVLTNPWHAAEVLLHEAMHCKFVDLEHTHSLLRHDYTPSGSPRIRPHWNRAAPQKVNEWPVNRALTVLHVYTCLALFFSNVVTKCQGLEGQYGPLHGLQPAKQARRAFDRAHYLRYQLEQSQDQLGVAGRLFLRWLHDILRAFDGAPPPEGSDVHLFLDLYEREGGEVRAFIAGVGSGGAPNDALCAKAMRQMAMRELGSARRVLSMMPDAPSVSQQLQQHDEAATVAAKASDESLHGSADLLLWVREMVTETLDALSPMIVEAKSSPVAVQQAPADVIRRMVKDSGHHLNELFGASRGNEAARERAGR